MSDLEIRSGGVVAVDTAELEHAAGRLDALAAECEVVQHRLADIAARVSAEGAWAAVPIAVAGDIVGHTRSIAADLRTLARLYEIVELQAQRSAAEAAGDELLVRSLTGRYDAAVGELSVSELYRLGMMSQDWQGAAHSEVAAQAVMAGLPGGPFGWIAAAWALNGLGLVRALGLGAVATDARLVGPPHAVRLGVAQPPAPAAAPGTLTEMIGRVPGGDDERVRVEQYEMADGSRQFVAYVAGTREFIESGEAFDMASNSQLYLGVRSASYDGVIGALKMAGAGTDDVVHLVGHSQGAMVASRVALEGEFRVQTNVSVGGPVEAAVGDDVLQVTLRHTDDPVVALAGGGFASSSGASGSFVAQRTYDPGVTPGEILDFDAHNLDAYAETTRMLDASSDPRMDAVREQLAHLSTATAVTATVYGVQQVERQPSGGGGIGGR